MFFGFLLLEEVKCNSVVLPQSKKVLKIEQYFFWRSETSSADFHNTPTFMPLFPFLFPSAPTNSFDFI